jgi:hypothetical protein
MERIGNQYHTPELDTCLFCSRSKCNSVASRTRNRPMWFPGSTLCVQHGASCAAIRCQLAKSD